MLFSVLMKLFLFLLAVVPIFECRFKDGMVRALQYVQVSTAALTSEGCRASCIAGRYTFFTTKVDLNTFHRLSIAWFANAHAIQFNDIPKKYVCKLNHFAYYRLDQKFRHF